MGGPVCDYGWVVYVQSGFNYRSGRTFRNLIKITREYRVRGIAYHRLYADDDAGDAI